MKLTNRLGLPLPIVKAVENDPYDNGGTLSVTTLIKPPQAHYIGAKHREEMTEDVADRIWALVGQVGHAILERAAMDPSVWISERRYYAELDGELISGQADLIHIDGGVVYDFKFTSGWAVKDARKGKSEWRQQLSVLAWLARRGQHKVDVGDHLMTVTELVDIKQGKILAIVRDWNQFQVQRDRDFPEKQVEVIDMDIMSDEETTVWLRERIREYKDAMNGSPRPCTNEERWHSPGKWAVTKRGNQRAAKLADTEEDLSAWIFANRSKVGNDPVIEQRPEVFKRCAKYCNAAPFCQQYKDNPGAVDEKEA